MLVKPLYLLETWRRLTDFWTTLFSKRAKKKALFDIPSSLPPALPTSIDGECYLFLSYLHVVTHRWDHFLWRVLSQALWLYSLIEHQLTPVVLRPPLTSGQNETFNSYWRCSSDVDISRVLLPLGGDDSATLPACADRNLSLCVSTLKTWNTVTMNAARQEFTHAVWFGLWNRNISCSLRVWNINCKWNDL